MGSNQPESPSIPSVDESAARMAVDIRRFRWMSRLACDYAYNFDAVAPFFAGDPTRRDAWADAIRRTQARRRSPSDVAAILAAQQERRDAPPRAREAARALADPRTVAIVTGQQAALFGGPLYTLLKALTAVRLAAQIAEEHRVPTVAVFWVDAEDHDWDEVRSSSVFGEGFAPATIALPSRNAAETAPASSVCLDGSIAAALEELERVLPPTDFRAALLADLRAAYPVGREVTRAFAHWIERVLGDRGLVVFESSDPAAKPLAAPIFVQELSTPGDTVRQANAVGAALAARGYHAQVQAADGVALFELNGARRPIRIADGHFLVGQERIPQPVLVARAHSSPAAFSPNVLLRPLVQDAIFPTVCYVAGPNELAYLGQLHDVYTRFGLPMPLMFPRASVTVVDAATLRFLHKYDVPLEALQPQDESTLNQLLQAQIPAAVEDAFGSAGKTIEAELNVLIAAIPALDPTLEGAARSTLGRMQHDLQTLHNKMIQAAKRRDETLRRQYLRARALTFPGGLAQERAIGFVSFLNQFGPALVDRLEHEVPLDPGQHWVVAV